MNDESLQRKIADAVWVAHSLFQRGKATGSTSNLGFIHDESLYITRSGACFGTLTPDDFSRMSMAGEHLGGSKASKEFPLHLSLLRSNALFGAVLHTHSIYATLWSCYAGVQSDSAVPQYTPYLNMKLGNIRMVPYAPPGTDMLFTAFSASLDGRGGYLLRNHGPIVAAPDIMQAFFAIEELEESCRIAWELRNEQALEI